MTIFCIFISWCVLFFTVTKTQYPPFTYHNHSETMQLVQNIITAQEKGAYLRIGDGDTALASGLNSGTHDSNSMLKKEAHAVLQMEGNNIIKTLPLDPHVYQSTENTQDTYFNAQRIEFIRNQAAPLWGNDRNVYSAQFLSHYAICDIKKCLNFLTFLKNSNCSLLIGNQEIPAAIRSLLFGPDCAFVAAPSRNAFSQIERIEQETLKHIDQLDPNKHYVIILSAGNTGRVLLTRIYDKIDKKVFFFDFGSLMDAICNFKARFWIRQYFNYELFLPQLKKALEAE